MELSQRKTGVILSYISLLVSTVINIINVPLFLNYIGTGEYGLYQTMGSLIAYFVILDFGLPATIVVFYSRYRTKNDNIGMENVLAICSRMYMFITVLITLVGAGLYFFLDQIYMNSLTSVQLISIKQMYIILVANIAITLPFQIFNAIITAYEKFIFLKGLSIVTTIMQAIAMVAVIINFPSAFSIVVVQTIFNIAVVIFRGYYCLRVLNVRMKLHFFDKKLFISILKYSFFIFLNVIVEQLFWRSSLIILSITGNPDIVAVYSITFQISYNYMILSTAITGVFLPKVTSMVSKGASKKELSNFFTGVGRIQALLLCCVLTGFIIFGRQFIALWSIGKPGFEKSFIMTLILLIPLTVDLIQGIGQTILQAVDRFYFRVLVFLVIDIINLCLCVPLSRVYGGMACSVINGITLLIGSAVVMNIYYHYKIGINIKDFWKQTSRIFIFAGVSALLGYCVSCIPTGTHVIFFVVKIILYMSIYTIIMWKFVMNEYEKGLIMKPLKKLIGRS